MKTLILKYKVKVPVDDDIEKAKKYFKDKDIEMEFDVKDISDKKLYLFLLPFGTIPNGQYLSGLKGIKEQLEYQKLVQEGYQACVFMWDSASVEFPKENGKTVAPTSWCNFSPINKTEFIQLHTNPNDDRSGWIWKSLTHELLHAMCKFVARTGRPIVDEMDITKDGQPYLNNNDPYQTDGNYVRTLANLKPYLDLFEPKKEVPLAFLVREKDTGKQTTGVFIYMDNGKPVIKYSLELAWKDNQRNISCIPKGVYDCEVYDSQKFGRKIYRLKDVPNRSGILIHPANFYTDIQGCIGLGNSIADINRDGQNDITNTNIAVNEFMTAMKNEPFKLFIL